MGFADKLRLMNVLMDDVKIIKEVTCAQLKPPAFVGVNPLLQF